MTVQSEAGLAVHHVFDRLPYGTKLTAEEISERYKVMTGDFVKPSKIYNFLLNRRGRFFTQERGKKWSRVQPRNLTTEIN